MTGRPTGRFRPGWTAAALVLTGALAAGCGGGGTKTATAAPTTSPAPTLSPLLHQDPTMLVQNSVAGTLGAGKAAVVLTVPVLSENTVSEVAGDGSIDFAADKLRLTVPDESDAEERQFGQTVYVRIPARVSQTLGGKSWLQVDLRAAQPKSPDPFNLYAFDPDQLVRALRATSSATLVGQEDVRGTLTGHFQATLDPAKLGGAGLQSAFAGQLRTASGGQPLPAEVYLDNTGLLRRVTVPLPPPGAVVPAGSTSKADLELFDFGTADTTFTQPGRSDVASVADIGNYGGD